jgi:PadR family transcriptional regulator, regulatory protein PadR
MPRRPSAQTLRVLAALAADPARWRHGYDLGREVGLGAGTLYPILMRLDERGLLESRWEQVAPQGRPARHEYRPTDAGLEVLAAAGAAATVHTGLTLRPREAR